MARLQKLRYDPITEALVDFRATPTRELDPSTLGDALRAQYPKMRDQREIKADFRFEKGKDPVATAEETGLLGYHYLTEDERSIAQFRRNGFTYNRLSPYPGGDAVLTEALRLWAIYVQNAAPAGVSRAALRYINHLSFPKERLRDFLGIPIEAPEGAGPVIQMFLNRVRSHDPETGLTVIRTIASAREKPSVNDAGLIIDVDAFRRADTGVSEGELRPVLDSLRILKNRVFFGTITDEAVEFLNEHDSTVRAD
jgi:uncharacterized protein (TIGR04255 family)